MILEMLFNLVLSLLNIVFGWVNFPPMPQAVVDACEIVLTSIESAMGILWLIVPRELVIILLPIVLIIENFDRMYSMIMWILKKIPFLNIQ